MTATQPDLILVVDDDAATRDTLALMLTNEGYRAVACEATEALALALLDVVMPNLDGPSLCRRLRELHGRGLPVIFLSGVPAHTVAALAVGCEPWDLLPKPCSAETLLTVVARHLPA